MVGLTDVVGYCVLDIVLVVDTSSSIREFQPPNVVNKELIINFLSELVNRPLEIGEYYDHVGVVTFASSARTLFDLRQRTSVEELRRGFRTLPDPNGETNTPDAINLALQVSCLFSSLIFNRSYCTRGPSKDWRRRTGRPRQTWLKTVQDDLRPLNCGLARCMARLG